MLHLFKFTFSNDIIRHYTLGINKIIFRTSNSVKKTIIIKFYNMVINYEKKL